MSNNNREMRSYLQLERFAKLITFTNKLINIEIQSLSVLKLSAKLFG